MHRCVKGGSQCVPPKVIDITEDAGQIRLFARRSASLKSVVMKAYHQIVETEIKRHFETSPVLKKIRAGDTVSDREIELLVSLILTQYPDVRREHVEEFFSEFADPLYLAIRAIIGIDPDVVREKFTAFAQKHPKLSVKQTRFHALLQNHRVWFYHGQCPFINAL